jgi:3-phenylpropionate/trans-cinnamate dioxygenase ferredoxin reductase component
VSGDVPLQRVLGPEVAPIFDELHRSHGAELRYRTTATELTGRHGAVTGVILSDGSRIDGDMIIVGIGAVPRTQLATAAGLKIDNGIVVDEHLRTSDPDIFAAGDIAHAYNPRLGRHIRVEHWANARRQGVVAGKAMLGQDAVDLRPSYFYTDQYDLSMEYTGDIGPAGYDRVIFRRYADSSQVIVFWLYEQRVQAGMTSTSGMLPRTSNGWSNQHARSMSTISPIRISRWPICSSCRSNSCHLPPLTKNGHSKG